MTTGIAVQGRELLIQSQALAQPLAACQWGPGEGPVLLALHGWLDNAASFQPLAGHLAGQRIIALELAGHGHSGHRPAGLPYHFSDYVADVLVVLDELKLERFHLLGHSMGAGIAAMVAALAPERITSLTLIEGAGPLAFSAQGAAEAMRHSMAQHHKTGRRQAPGYRSFESAVRARLRGSEISPAAAQLLAERGVTRVGERFRWRSDLRVALRSPYYFTEEQVEVFLLQITAPTLALVGNRSRIGDRERLQRRLGLIRQLRCHEMPGSHYLHMEHPAEVADLLQSHLAACDGGE